MCRSDQLCSALCACGGTSATRCDASTHHLPDGPQTTPTLLRKTCRDADNVPRLVRGSSGARSGRRGKSMARGMSPCSTTPACAPPVAARSPLGPPDLPQLAHCGTTPPQDGLAASLFPSIKWGTAGLPRTHQPPPRRRPPPQSRAVGVQDTPAVTSWHPLPPTLLILPAFHSPLAVDFPPAPHPHLPHTGATMAPAPPSPSTSWCTWKFPPGPSRPAGRAGRPRPTPSP